MLLLLLVAALAAADAGGALVEHSLDAGRTFVRAGSIQLTEDDDADGAAAVRATFEREPVSDGELAQLAQLVEADRLYLWRVQLPGQPAVLTSIKAACLAPVFAAPRLALALDGAGRLVSAQLSVPPAAAPEGRCSTSDAFKALQGLSAASLAQPGSIDVAVHTPTVAPAVPKGQAAGGELPDLMGGGQQQQQQKQQQKQQQQQQQQRAGGGQQQQGGEGGEAAAPPVDDRTWLQKNWLVVMMGCTMVLNIVMRSLAGPEDGQRVGPAGPGRAAAPQQRRAQ